MQIHDEPDGLDSLPSSKAEEEPTTLSLDHTLNFLQVVAGGIGGAIGLVGVVIAYLAWTHPHNASDGSPTGAQATAPTVTSPAQSASPTSNGGPSSAVPGSTRYLANIPPDAGSAYLMSTKNARNLTIHCASGQSGDKSHTIEYDLFGVYETLKAGASVGGPVRPESVAQVEVKADSQEVSRVDLTVDAHTTRIVAPLGDAQSMSITVVCQDPAGVITLSSPTLYR